MSAIEYLGIYDDVVYCFKNFAIDYDGFDEWIVSHKNEMQEIIKKCVDDCAFDLAHNGEYDSYAHAYGAFCDIDFEQEG